jgi:predicted ATPase
MRPRCVCERPGHQGRLVVLTGGPGAGKTSILELIKKSFCAHVDVLPEAAGIVFGGGFPRRPDPAARRASQRAIFHVQRELERLALEERQAAVILCDRGTVDGLAYWPGPPSGFWEELGLDRERELARYHAVIHLRTPPEEDGYDRSNRLRIETAEEARRIDERIADAWQGHRHRAFVAHHSDFLEKVAQTLALVRAEVPACCREHPVPAVGEQR